MSLTEKPWMKAKTLSEATMLADDHVRAHFKIDGKSAPFIVPGIHLITSAVIEWHEAQRTKVEEWWEVSDSGHHWKTVDRSSFEAGPRATVTHVTRYRRKKR